MTHAYTLIRASIAHFPDAVGTENGQLTTYEDGALVLNGAKIESIGDYATIRKHYLDAVLVDYQGCWLVPGFIDSHLHFPQTEIIAKYGEQLLTWLENYTFPTEYRFKDEQYSERVANAFIRQCLKNGTTTPMVYSSVHKSATDVYFTQASKRNMLTIAGKVCMDQHCPPWLQDTPESAQQDSAQLIADWHNKGRNYVALTPRFAPTSSRKQLQALGELAQQYPDTFIQTHLSENPQEIEWVKSLYPEFNDYLSVYENYHMLRPRAVYGHCIHLSNSEWQRMASSGATAAFCPTSNLFLGSGLFDLDKAREHQAHVSLATDVGGGTSFSMLKTLGEAYKICQLRGVSLSPLDGFYTLTQGAAVALGLADKIGNLNPGTDADFVVLNPRFDELSELRITNESCQDFADTFFALSILGDDRATRATWIAGSIEYDCMQEQPYAMA